MLSSAAYSSYLVPVLGGSTDTENAFDEEPDTNEIKRRSNRDSRSCIITKLSYCEIVLKSENEKCFLVEKKRQQKKDNCYNYR